MQLKALVMASALAFAATPALASMNLGDPTPSMSFANTVMGGFTDIWTFTLPTQSAVATSVTNVQVTFSGFGTSGGILGFQAFLNGVELFGPTSTTNIPPISITTQVKAGSALLNAGTYELKISGTGITGGTASYGGNIAAVPVPELETWAMLIAGIGMVALQIRRKSRTSGKLAIN
jgi:hypothetical protein